MSEDFLGDADSLVPALFATIDSGDHDFVFSMINTFVNTQVLVNGIGVPELLISQRRQVWNQDLTHQLLEMYCMSRFTDACEDSATLRRKLLDVKMEDTGSVYWALRDIHSVESLFSKKLNEDLQQAVTAGRQDAVESLITKGADVHELSNDDINAALKVACAEKALGTVSLLLSAGADCWYEPLVSIMLDHVAEDSWSKVVRMLDMRVEVNATVQPSGDAALHRASSTSMVISLFDAKADLFRKNGKSQTPLDVAMASSRADVAAILVHLIETEAALRPENYDILVENAGSTEYNGVYEAHGYYDNKPKWRHRDGHVVRWEAAVQTSKPPPEPPPNKRSSIYFAQSFNPWAATPKDEGSLDRANSAPLTLGQSVTANSWFGSSSSQTGSGGEGKWSMGGYYISRHRTEVPPTTDWQINYARSPEPHGRHPPPSVSYHRVDGCTVHSRRISLLVQSAEDGDINEIRRLIQKNPLLLDMQSADTEAGEDSNMDLVSTVLAQKSELLASVSNDTATSQDSNIPPLSRVQSDNSVATMGSSSLMVRRSHKYLRMTSTSVREKEWA